ncbi:MAG: hypothetical protein WBG41_17450, partial [Acidimicrobiales bacterium]
MVFEYETFTLAADSFGVVTVSGTSGATYRDSVWEEVALPSTTVTVKDDVPGDFGVPEIVPF